LNELQTMSGRDHHNAVRFFYLPRLYQFEEHRQPYASVRAVKHSSPVGHSRRIGELLLARLLDDAVELLQRANRFLKTDRVADLDRAGERLLRLNRLEHFKIA